MRPFSHDQREVDKLMAIAVGLVFCGALQGLTNLSYLSLLLLSMYRLVAITFLSHQSSRSLTQNTVKSRRNAVSEKRQRQRITGGHK